MDHIQSLKGYGEELMTPLERKIYELEQLILSVKEGVVNEAETQKTTIEALSE